MGVVEIDGSMGEGGGQILRYAAALSALTLTPVRIYNIRAKRENPGLRPQHLTALKVLGELSDAEIEGLAVGSREVVFKPRKRRSGNLVVDIGTAGSVSLVIQAILPVLIFGDTGSKVILRGGTNVPWSPPIDYIQYVLLPNLEKLGVKASVELVRRGHYPKGGGEVILRVEKTQKVRSVELVKRGRVIKAAVISHCVKLPRHVAERQAKTAREIFERLLGVKPEVYVESYPPEKDPHLSPGSGVLVYVEAEPGVRLGGDALGEKGKPAEKVGEEAAVKLLGDLETGMALDTHMGDMIVPYLFVADGISRVGVAKLTLHTMTAIQVSKLFFPDAQVEVVGSEGQPGFITVRGVAFSP